MVMLVHIMKITFDLKLKLYINKRAPNAILLIEIFSRVFQINVTIYVAQHFSKFSFLFLKNIFSRCLENICVLRPVLYLDLKGQCGHGN